MPKLTKSFIDKLLLGGDYTEWDDALPGFGIRVRGTVKTWIVKYRNSEGRQRKMSIGRSTSTTPDEARALAKKYIGQVASGYDPAEGKIEIRNAITVSELCDLYIKDKGWLATGRKDKKASTIAMDKSRIERHVKPLLGKRKVISLTQQDLFNFMKDVSDGRTAKNEKSDNLRGRIIVKGGPGAAARTMGMFGAILQYAAFNNFIQTNPAHGIAKPQGEEKKERLSINKIQILGKLMNNVIGELNSSGLDAIRLLLLTGCRKMEILSLKWNMIDFENQCFLFDDTKTGRQTRPIGASACKLLKDMKNSSRSNWVFPATIGNGHYVGLPKLLDTLSKRKFDKKDKSPALDIIITAHMLRHT
ncbi:MAG: integrase arm-type DNA-binding domain-containing protein, partial [Lactobacillus sp.]|nr:integrase arm-type DNA-binding domain-containing protein [Lactobacillus sp.]